MVNIMDKPKPLTRQQIEYRILKAHEFLAVYKAAIMVKLIPEEVKKEILNDERFKDIIG